MCESKAKPVQRSFFFHQKINVIIEAGLAWCSWTVILVGFFFKRWMRLWRLSNDWRHLCFGESFQTKQSFGKTICHSDERFRLNACLTSVMRFANMTIKFCAWRWLQYRVGWEVPFLFDTRWNSHQHKQFKCMLHLYTGFCMYLYHCTSAKRSVMWSLELISCISVEYFAFLWLECNCRRLVFNFRPINAIHIDVKSSPPLEYHRGRCMAKHRSKLTHSELKQ